MIPEHLPKEFTTPDFLQSVELGELDDSQVGSPSRALASPTIAAWGERSDFDDYIKSLGLRYFQPEEFLVKGGAHHSGTCAGRNTDPPRHLWPNIAKTAEVLDELRHRLGYSLRLTSVYRSPAYNTCIGQASGSYHMAFNACDFVGAQGSPADWRDALRSIRNAGAFQGGIGYYSSFVHVDTRGRNADW